MCILTGREIYKRRDSIFSGGSWSCESFQEVSYDLRVDTEPVLRIGGKLYENGIKYEGNLMRIEPGEMVLLPTMETFNMPRNLVGDIKIKLSHSRRGLTPLFGPKIDPYFGTPYPDERMYLWVSNLGIDTITLERGERVFTVQFHKLWGDAPEFKQKDRKGPEFARGAYKMGTDPSLGFVSKIEGVLERKLGDRLTRAEQGYERVVLFGVLLVASALLAGAVTTLFMMMPNLATESGTITLVGSLFMIPLYGVCIVLAFAVLLLSIAAVLQTLRPPKRGD